LNIRRDLLVHWLPVGHRITYKLCLTTWKTLHASQPLYLSELISHYLPPRSLRSFDTNLLTRPAGITSNFSSRAFSVSAPSTRNSLSAQHTFVLSIPYPPLNATKISSLPVCLYRLVILCQRLRFINVYVCICMWGEAQADKRFGAYWSQKVQLWWQHFFLIFLRTNVIFCTKQARVHSRTKKKM